ncbi:MAG: hypothetical protein K6U87_05795 [Firmicutes bacterium]|nr:hypothetical protein [Bacillota bacterium]
MNQRNRWRRRGWGLAVAALAVLWGAPPTWAAGSPTAVALQVQQGGQAWIVSSTGYQQVSGTLQAEYAAPSGCAANGCVPQVAVTVEGGGAAVVDGWTQLPFEVVGGLPTSPTSASFGENGGSAPTSNQSGASSSGPQLVVEPPVGPTATASSLPGHTAESPTFSTSSPSPGGLAPGDTPSYEISLAASATSAVVGQSITLTANYLPNSLASWTRVPYRIIDTTSGDTVADCSGGACTATVTGVESGNQTYQAFVDGTDSWAGIPASAPVTVQWVASAPVPAPAPPGGLTVSAPPGAENAPAPTLPEAGQTTVPPVSWLTLTASTTTATVGQTVQLSAQLQNWNRAIPGSTVAIVNMTTGQTVKQCPALFGILCTASVTLTAPDTVTYQAEWSSATQTAFSAPVSVTWQTNPCAQWVDAGQVAVIGLAPLPACSGPVQVTVTAGGLVLLLSTPVTGLTPPPAVGSGSGTPSAGASAASGSEGPAGGTNPAGSPATSPVLPGTGGSGSAMSPVAPAPGGSGSAMSPVAQ